MNKLTAVVLFIPVVFSRCLIEAFVSMAYAAKMEYKALKRIFRD